MASATPAKRRVSSGYSGPPQQQQFAHQGM